MRKWYAILLGMVYVSGMMAEPTVVPDPIPCVKNLELNFFEEKIVYQGLNFYGIRQELWSLIYQRLRMTSTEVPGRMKRKTAFMVPNPIEYPMQKGLTAKILKEVLLEIFLETMRFYQVNERPTADFVFDYIFARQLPLFVNCFGKEAEKLRTKFD